MVNPVTDAISSPLRPNGRATQPVNGRTIALATRYEVRTQVDSSIVADRLPAMCGSDTLTTVVSSTSMNVANITETAMSHGLMCFCSVIGLLQIDRRRDGQPRPQQVIRILAWVEDDLHRHALHDLDEVA